MTKAKTYLTLPKSISYKVIDKVNLTERKTTFQTQNILRPELYNYIDEKIRQRFSKYDYSVNHSGRTITLHYQEDY